MATNPDVKAAQIDPVKHYVRFGSAEGRRPRPEFDPVFYLQTYADVRANQTEPFYHYLTSGRDEGRHSAAETDIEAVVGAELRRAESFFETYRSAWQRGGFALQRAALDLAKLRPSGVVAAGTAPDVSIIIPVFGQMPFVLNCLDGIARHASTWVFEVLVVDDCSPLHAGTRHLEMIPWVSVIRTGSNVGFVRACNLGAQKARGRYIFFLNSDTRVYEGWVDELIRTFVDHPLAGLVGSKLVNPDGSLQEAGGIVWQDGSAWNYGRGSNPGYAEFSFARRVDYCSGAAIAIPRQLWDQLGGFDEHFAPAYYEDVDLAFRVRAAGREVWYQPLACVIHYEGRTHGRDETVGVKAYQKVNAAKFAVRWDSVLRSHRARGVAPHLESNRSVCGRLLAIDALTPTPDRDAGSVMALGLLQIMQRLGWQVSFLAADNPYYDARYSTDLQREGIETLTLPGFRTVQDVVRARPDYFDAVLGFRVLVFADMVDLLRAAYPAASILYHVIDLHYLRMEREAALKDDRLMLRKAVLIREQELGLIAKVDCTIVPSTAERDIVEGQLAVTNVVVYPYTSSVRASSADFESRRHLAFVGGFRHPPNVDAVLNFLDNAWPTLSTSLPERAKFYVIGPDPPKELQDRADDRVVITGYLETLDAVLDECRVFVAPLRFGAGLKGKVVTSLAHGVPCVATRIAIEGMELTPEVHVLVADDAATQIEMILRLYRDKEEWLRLQRAGYEFVQRNYSWEAGIEIARNILDVAEDTWFRRRRSILLSPNPWESGVPQNALSPALGDLEEADPKISRMDRYQQKPRYSMP